MLNFETKISVVDHLL